MKNTIKASGVGNGTTMAGLLLLSAGLARGQCVQQWDGDFGVPAGMNGDILALTAFDIDGPGPLPEQLIAAGSFTTGAGQTVNKIARWDGVSWRSLGSGIGPINTTIYCMMSWDPDGAGPLPAQLIVGGNFATSTNVAGNFIQRWDVSSQSWLPLGSGMNNVVYALAFWDPDGAGPIQPQLIAGGDFTTAGGVVVNHIARWDGAAWQALGAGAANGTVTALSTVDPGAPAPLLVAGGTFTNIGGVACNRIARYDGLTWQPMGAGFTNSGATVIYAMEHYNGQLIAAGVFSLSGSTPISNIARWDGAAWQPLGSGVDNIVGALTIWDPDGPGAAPAELVAGGTFTTAGGNSITRIAHWNGSAWQGFGAVSVNNFWVYALANFDPDGAGPAYLQLAAGGDFTQAAGNIANHVAAWVSAPAPVVITSPSPVTSGCPGGQVSYTVRAAAGAFPSYQWRKNGLNLADGATGTGSILSGTHSVTLTISNMSAADTASYDVIVTNGCGSATSAAAGMSGYCYANCDCSSTSPNLNVNDFTCFLNRFAAGNPLANCDGSTTAPILNVLDFTCFLNRFATGCT